jgi:hypothetical protein
MSRIKSKTEEAIELMIKDLKTRREEIRHQASFKGCNIELVKLQKELLEYLENKKRSDVVLTNS